MNEKPEFLDAAPYQDNVLALPVADIEMASSWYAKHFGMTEVKRDNEPVPSVILERDGVQIGFAVNGGDATQDGAAIRVKHVKLMMDELVSKGVNAANYRIDERDGKKYQVFFVVAPDGLCYYFNEPLDD